MDTAAGWRGGQNQVLLAASGMARRGHAVTVACRRGGELEKRLRAAAIDTAALPFAGDWSPRAAWGLRRLAAAFRPDVVHAHDPHAIAAALAVPAPRVASRRVDFPVRGPASRWKYARCGRVVAVSRAVADVLGRGGVDPGRVRLVYEGVPDRPPQPGGRDALAGLGVPADALVVGNVAALTDHKDHRTLLAAAALVAAREPRAWFVIVGDGELRGALEADVQARGLQGRVRFAGFRGDLDRLIPAFDVFCLSSKMEGLGTSLLDAMCFARPVVATAAGGIPEAVEDGITGRVAPPGDAPALADALAVTLADPGLRARYGAAGRARFEETFSADRMVDGTLAVYGEVA